LVPFNVHFEQDTTLQDILLAEAPGILRWAVEGLKQ
jgi:phage/plasmid-associated DNA primase